VTRKDIMCEPGAERIAFRSTQGTGRHLKSRWTELEVWFRHQADGRPPFVTVVAGRSSVPGEDQRETVQEAATLRVAGTHFMRDTLPAQAVRDEAQQWWDDYRGSRVRVVVAHMEQCEPILALVGAESGIEWVDGSGAIMAKRITRYRDRWDNEWELEQSNGGMSLYRIGEQANG